MNSEVVFTDHAAVHDPDPVCLTILRLHDLDHLLGSGHIGTIAVKDLKGERQSFSRCHKADTHLGTIGTAVAAIAPLCLGVACGAAFEVGGGAIVEEKVEGSAEELTIPFLKMPTPFILVRQKGVQGAVEPVVVDLIAGTPRRSSSAVLPYHDSAICNSDDGAQRRARTRMQAMTD